MGESIFSPKAGTRQVQLVFVGVNPNPQTQLHKKCNFWKFPLWLGGHSPTSFHEDAGLIPGLHQWVKGFAIAMSYGVGHRRGSDPTLLCLWCRFLCTEKFSTQLSQYLRV